MPEIAPLSPVLVEFFVSQKQDKPVVVAKLSGFASLVVPPATNDTRDTNSVPTEFSRLKEKLSDENKKKEQMDKQASGLASDSQDGSDDGGGGTGQSPSSATTPRPAEADKDIIGEKDFISEITLDSHPLEILDFQTSVQYDRRLGVVELHEVGEFEEPLMLNSHADGGFFITYRTAHKSETLFRQMNSNEMPADVAAVIARAFLLAKISSYRTHASNILKDYGKVTDTKDDGKTTATERQKTLSERLSNGLAEMAKGLEDFIKRNRRDASVGNDASYHKVPLALLGGSALWITYLAVTLLWAGSSAWLPSPQWATPLFVALVAALLLALSGYSLSTLKYQLRRGWAWLGIQLPLGREQGPSNDKQMDQVHSSYKDIQNGAFGLALAGATSLPGALLVWLAWPMLKYGQHGQTPDAFDFVILILLGCAATILLLVASNFQTRVQKDHLKAYEKAKGCLDEILSSFAQTNANVAALNFTHKIVGIVDETRLRELDDAFRTKEAVISLESVIRARQRYVHENVAGLLERQQRARRTVLAAGSGMFAGYFTYEVGGSVMKFVDLPAGFDEHSYGFWMAMKNPQARFVTDTTGDTTTKPCVLELLPYPPSGSETFSVINLQVTPEKCKAAQEIADFRAKYHKDELMDAGVLLIVTLIVSLVTAWVAVRKPEKEQSPT